MPFNRSGVGEGSRGLLERQPAVFLQPSLELGFQIGVLVKGQLPRIADFIYGGGDRMPDGIVFRSLSVLFQERHQV